MYSSDRARTRASSTSATASRSPCGSRATTILQRSSRSRGRPPGSVGSCVTSSPWVPGPSPSWTRSSWARSRTPRSRFDLRRRRPGHRRLWQFGGGADRGRPALLLARLPRQPACQCALPRRAADRAARVGACHRRRQSGGAARVAHGTRRDRWGEHPRLGRPRAEGGRRGRPRGDAGKRPSVQVGDPYEEKRLIEACLALLDAGLVVGIQDLGGAGLTCATCETASRAGLGMDVDISAVPCRRTG